MPAQTPMSTLVLYVRLMQSMRNECPRSVQIFPAKQYKKPSGMIFSDTKVLNEKEEKNMASKTSLFA